MRGDATLAYCDLGSASVLLEVQEVIEVADADALSPDENIIDVGALLGQPEGTSRRRALLLAGCVRPTWLLVGADVRFLARTEIDAQVTPPFIANHLRAMWIRGIASRGEKLAYQLDGDRLRAHFGRGLGP